MHKVRPLRFRYAPHKEQLIQTDLAIKAIRSLAGHFLGANG